MASLTLLSPPMLKPMASLVSIVSSAVFAGVPLSFMAARTPANRFSSLREIVITEAPVRVSGVPVPIALLPVTTSMLP